MNTVSEEELDRQYRVLKQSIAMHSMLRDQYTRLAAVLDISLLAASVIFCATTFACEYISQRLGVPDQIVSDILGISSIIAFLAVLVGMVLNWKGKATLHGESAKTLTNALALFRETRIDDSWPTEKALVLSQTYWDASQSTVPIPDKRFTALKARYLRKVEVSKTASCCPGCPLFLIRILVFCRSICSLAKKQTKTDTK